MYAFRLQRTRTGGRLSEERRSKLFSLSEKERERESKTEKEIYFVIRGGVVAWSEQLWSFGMRTVFTLDLNQIYVAPGAPRESTREGAHIRIQDETHSYFFLYDRTLQPHAGC